MDFNFPTVTHEPIIIINYKNGNAAQIQKISEDRLKEHFKSTKAKCKFYLIKFTPETIEIDEFNDDSYFIVNNDFLAEMYYTPTGQIIISYTRFEKTNFKNHLENIKTR